MTIKLRKITQAIKAGPGAAGIWIDQLSERFTVTKKTANAVEQSIVAVHSKGVTSKTAAFTVALPADDGKTFKLAAAAGIVVTLPAISAANAGHRVRFVNASLPTSNHYAISPAAADSIAYGADNKDIINTAATDALGDQIELESDGVDTWIVTSQTGVWAKEA